jgi:asparagine synthase (glutamine-hydrolysing)
MCGINVIARQNQGKMDVEDLARMNAAITHRGPDNSGYALLDSGSVDFGHVRLSVIDLQTGDQPLYNEDESVCIIFNGEIYDYKPLRSDLIAAGHRFRTDTDTEVIVHLYEQYGMDFVDKLNGEFAFALWDQSRQQLIAVKDRCGIKPLFYYHDGIELIISSEVKGIFSLARVPRQIDADYLVGPVLGTFPKAASLFTGIKCLKPGHMLIMDRTGIPAEKPYWRPSFNVNSSMTFEEAKTSVNEIFTRAVKRRMVADVPVGTYLSGGLDSTLVCALMARETSHLKAFNVGFGTTIYDESSLAQKIAKHFGAKFETIDCTNEILGGNLLKALYHVEQPIANPNSFAKQVLSSLVHSQNYKVCITGEGSDEIFGGYAYFKLEKLWRMMRAGGEERKKASQLLAKFRNLEIRSKGLLWDRGNEWKVKDPLLGYPNFTQMRITESSVITDQLIVPKLLSHAHFSSPLELFEKEFVNSFMKGLDPFNATKLITFNQLSNYIIPTLGDRVEMANSVECRTPFLDRDLVDFAGTVPPSYFMNIDELREKHLLREAFQGMLPEFVWKEHKHPFLSPNWQSISQSGPGQEICAEFLSCKSIREAQMFRPIYVEVLKHFLARLA